MTGPPTGGAPFETPVGTFWPGNLTPDPETGLGSWTAEQFVDAMTRGVSPDGRHYFPAFPYPSYRTMPVEDILDLWAYLQTLEPVRSPAAPPTFRCSAWPGAGSGCGNDSPSRSQGFRPDPEQSEAWNRGAYLVERPRPLRRVPHPPQRADDPRRRAAPWPGGPHPRGEGTVPGPARHGGTRAILGCADLVLALQFGETFGYDRLSSGGMADIQMNLAKLPEDDLRAIAEYLLSLE